MENKEIDDSSKKSYIEVEDVSTARALYPHEKKFSQLIQEHYNKEKKLLQKSVELKNNTFPLGAETLASLVENHYISEIFDKSLVYVKRNKQFLIIYYIKIQDLEDIDDVYGQKISNMVLNTVTKRLMKVVGTKNYLSRISKRKYLVCSILSKHNLIKVEKLLNQVQFIFLKPIVVEGFTITVDVSISNVSYPINGDKIRVLLDILEMKLIKMNQIV